jgi:predicted metal-dependent hydrolase
MALVIRRHSRARRLIMRLIAGEDRVIVTIPQRAPFADGIALAQHNLDWIARRMAARPARVPFADGALVPLRGIDHCIRHCPHGDFGILAEVGLIRIGGGAQSMAARLEAWLRHQARVDLTAQAAAFADRLEQPFGRISVRDTRSRWGSCAANGNLSFCWRLILAPPAVLAYVVAHELAHLVERNHGPLFWAQVASIAGDVADARAWLKRHGPGLHRYG